MTELNRKKLEPGITKIGIISPKSKDGSISEYNLYFGNAVYKDNKVLGVHENVYMEKVKKFLDSEEGKDYEKPTDEEIKIAFSLARTPEIKAKHAAVPTVKESIVSKEELLKDINNSGVTVTEKNLEEPVNTTLENKNSEESNDGLSLDRLVDEQMKIEAQKNHIESERERLEREKQEGLEALKKLQEEIARKTQLIEENNKHLEDTKAEYQHITDNIENQKAADTQKKAEMEMKEQEFAKEKAAIDAERNKLKEEREAHAAVLAQAKKIEEERTDLNNKWIEVRAAAEKNIQNNAKYEELVRDVNNQKAKLNEKANELETKTKELEEKAKSYAEEKESLEQKLNEVQDKFAELEEERDSFRSEQKEANAEKHYTSRIALATGITTASVLASIFMGLCLFNVIPGMNPSGKAGDKISVVKMKNDVPEGTVITQDDIEEVSISASEFEELSTNDDKALPNGTVTLWKNANYAVGNCAIYDLNKDSYLMTSEYVIGSGEATVNTEN